MHQGDQVPRKAEARLLEALEDTPVVLIHGPRQCGKTTLARMVGIPRGYTYFNFDDAATLAAVKADPVGFVADAPHKTILDEVQRVPELFAAIKTTVDRNRIPGRFIVTGSTNILLLPMAALVWKSNGWKWFFLGALFIFLLNGATGTQSWGFLVGNFAEVVFMLSLLGTWRRFSRPVG